MESWPSSEVSAWVRMKPAPCATSQSIACLARALTDSRSRIFFCLAQIGDALVQRAGDVGLQVRGEHRVEMDVRVDQRARDEPAPAVDGLAGLRRDPRLDRHDALALDGDVGRAHGLVLVRDESVLQNDVHTRLSPMWARGPRLTSAGIFAQGTRNRQPGASVRNPETGNRPACVSALPTIPIIHIF